jgi:hypothetical protein
VALQTKGEVLSVTEPDIDSDGPPSISEVASDA